MKKETFLQVIRVSSPALLGFLLAWVAFPRVKTVERTVPEIVTKYDTTYRVPTWLEDSLKIWKKKVYVSDTIPVYHNVTFVDTNFVTVVDTQHVRIGNEEVGNAYPILEYHSNGNFGDTGTVLTYNIRSGTATASRFFTAGVLSDLKWDSTPVPRLNFKPFPPKEKHNWLYGPKIFGLGLLSGTTACMIVNTVR